MKPIDKILGRLKDVRKVGTGWQFRCEAHEDKTASGSAAEGDDGRVLIKCHAGCKAEKVVAAAGLTMADLFVKSNTSITTHANGSTKPKLASAPIDEAVVDQCYASLTTQARSYLKDKRRLSDEVIDLYKLGTDERNGEKRFTIPIRDKQDTVRDMRRWLPPEYRAEDENKKMLHWRRGYGGARLFPIDQLDADDLILCEGELDALALISHGIPAITATCGVSTWSDRLSESFSGKRVKILMDNDEPGYSGALKRAESLSRFGVKVRL